MCEKCSYGIWCPTWAEWKCTLNSRRMVNPVPTCGNFKSKAKDEEEPKCQCRDCLDRGEVECPND